MSLSTTVKTLANRFLDCFDVRMDSNATLRREANRIRSLAARGQFSNPIFPTPDLFRSEFFQAVLDAIPQYKVRFGTFENSSLNDVGFLFDNDYFSSPDAEVLYTMIRTHRPQTVVEVGCGNSTRLIRQAIIDGGLATRLVSIDPAPRTDIAQFSDVIWARPVEEIETAELASLLKSGDILFIDSSHIANTGGDVVFLYLVLIPRLASEVLVHVHDIWLPYDYPKRWAEDWKWNEQYLVQAMLSFGCRFDVLWAGHYLERTLPDFDRYFPYKTHRPALSLWMRKTHGAEPGSVGLERP